MRTVSGFGRQVGKVLSRVPPRRSTPVALVALVASETSTVERRPLVSDRIGEQRHAGAVLDQVDGTTCGSAVLVALAAWADPAEVTRLEVPPGGKSLVGAGFGARYDAARSRFTARPTGSGRRRWARRPGVRCGGCGTTHRRPGGTGGGWWTTRRPWTSHR